MRTASRELKELISVGPALLRDFKLLGIRSVAHLAKQDPRALYAKLGRVARRHQDICVLDTFHSAIAQARNPRLPADQCRWWWWSRKRKKAAASRARQGAGR
jgi:nucleotidyltransferase/DNA polymerase involved in DNA repair